jgi:hypothetical protein
VQLHHASSNFDKETCHQEHHSHKDLKTYYLGSWATKIGRKLRSRYAKGLSSIQNWSKIDAAIGCFAM